jgi:uncharacterized protein (TIGR02246 family)
MSDDAQAVRAIVEAWVGAINRHDLEGVLANHAADIVMYDVPPPYDGVRGIDAYRDTWPPFFDWLRSGAVFERQELDVTVGGDVAFAHGLLRCGKPDDLATRPDVRLRVTVGMRKQGERWVVTHEHHSFPSE